MPATRARKSPCRDARSVLTVRLVRFFPQIISDDYSKMAFICADRSVAFHAKFGVLPVLMPGHDCSPPHAAAIVREQARHSMCELAPWSIVQAATSGRAFPRCRVTSPSSRAHATSSSPHQRLRSTGADPIQGVRRRRQIQAEYKSEGFEVLHDEPVTALACLKTCSKRSASSGSHGFLFCLFCVRRCSLNLELGRFQSPLPSRSTGVNCLGVSPVHELVRKGSQSHLGTPFLAWAFPSAVRIC